MLAADAELDVGPGRPAAIGRHLDQLADALDYPELTNGSLG